MKSDNNQQTLHTTSGEPILVFYEGDEMIAAYLFSTREEYQEAIVDWIDGADPLDWEGNLLDEDPDAADGLNFNLVGYLTRDEYGGYIVKEDPVFQDLDCRNLYPTGYWVRQKYGGDESQEYHGKDLAAAIRDAKLTWDRLSDNDKEDHAVQVYLLTGEGTNYEGPEWYYDLAAEKVARAIEELIDTIEEKVIPACKADALMTSMHDDDEDLEVLSEYIWEDGLRKMAAAEGISQIFLKDLEDTYHDTWYEVEKGTPEGDRAYAEAEALAREFVLRMKDYVKFLESVTNDELNGYLDMDRRYNRINLFLTGEIKTFYGMDVEATRRRMGELMIRYDLTRSQAMYYVVNEINETEIPLYVLFDVNSGAPHIALDAAKKKMGQ